MDAGCPLMTPFFVLSSQSKTSLYINSETNKTRSFNTETKVWDCLKFRSDVTSQLFWICYCEVYLSPFCSFLKTVTRCYLNIKCVFLSLGEINKRQILHDNLFRRRESSDETSSDSVCGIGKHQQVTHQVWISCCHYHFVSNEGEEVV